MTDFISLEEAASGGSILSPAPYRMGADIGDGSAMSTAVGPVAIGLGQYPSGLGGRMSGRYDYPSPLAGILSELRRTHSSAAGSPGASGGGGGGGGGGGAASSLAGGAGETGISTYGSDVDAEDMARRISEEEAADGGGVGPWAGGSAGSAEGGGGFCACPGEPSHLPLGVGVGGMASSAAVGVGGLFGGRGGFGGGRKKPASGGPASPRRGGKRPPTAPGAASSAVPTSAKEEVGDAKKRAGESVSASAPSAAVAPNVCPVCRNRKRFDPLGEVYRQTGAVLSASQPSAPASLAASSHADDLLRSTPHLRHLCPASTDMQGAGNVSTSRNLLSLIALPSVARSGGSESAGPKGTGLSDAASATTPHHHHHHHPPPTPKKGETAILDYRTCLARNVANRRAALELAAFLRVLAHEMSLEEYAAAENSVFKSVFALAHSADNNDRLAGVAALDALIGVASADEEKKAIKFAYNLSNGLQKSANNDYEFLAAVSRALGRMAMGTANVDYVEMEATRALEWLRTERSDRRLAASLTLKELARNAPTAFYSKTSQSAAATVHHGAHTAVHGSNEFLDHIFPVLRDPQPIVRACAADAFAQCLKVLMDRRNMATTGLLCQAYSDILEGFKPPHQRHRGKKRGGSGGSGGGAPPSSAAVARAEAANHGSLLAVGGMLEHTGDFMLPRFDEICRTVLGFASHPKALIRLEVVRLVPQLARRCPGAFGRRYLSDGLTFLIDGMRNPPPPRVGIDVRPSAFSSMGRLARAMGARRGRAGTAGPILAQQPGRSGTADLIIGERLEEIFDLVRAGLRASSSSLRGSSSSSSSRGGGVGGAGSGGSDMRCEALQCGADLIEALGDGAAPYVMDLLDDMFQSGLSIELIHSLHRVAVCMPLKQPLIQERLLQELSLCLAGTPAARTICDPLARSKRTATSTARREGGNTPSSAAKSLHPVSSARSLSWTMRTRIGSQTALSEHNADGDGGLRPIVTPRARPRGDSFPTGRQLAKATSGGSQTNQEGGLSPNVRINMSDKPDAVEKLVLSLHTLGSFGDSGGAVISGGAVGTLLPFVRDVVAQYLSHPSGDVRREAALTCSVHLLPYDETYDSLCSSAMAANFRQGTLGIRGARGGPLLRSNLGNASGSLIEEVLQKLLRVAVSDPSSLVRLCVIRALDARYDPFLCQAHHLAPVFLLLQDEALAARAAGLQLLGRLAKLNPAPILPTMRSVLMELIMELRCGGDTGGGKEEATRLLVVFLRAEALQRLVHPFLPSIIGTLPLKGVAPRLASAALEALGELAKVCRSSLTPWVRQLIPHILETMQDQSSASKQRTSLRTLGQIAGGTGYTIRPYLDYPQLLPLAADVLPGTKRAPWALRREVIRTFGIIGALDPDRYNAVAPKTRKGGGVGGGYFIEQEDDDIGSATNNRGAAPAPDASQGRNDSLQTKGNADPLSALSSSVPNQPGVLTSRTSHINQVQVSSADAHHISSQDVEDDEAPAHLFMYGQYAMTSRPVSKLPPARRLTPADEDFYPTVAVQALTRILKDPSLAVHHGMAMQAIMFIFNSLGLRCVPFLNRVVPHILHTIRTCGQPGLREALLQQVTSLSGIVKDHLRPYVPAVFEVVEELWSTRHLATLLALVSKMATGVPDDFRHFVPRLVRKLLASLAAVRVADWVSYPRQDGPGSATYEVEKLELILRSIRGLRGILGDPDYNTLLVPALVKLSDSLINPASSTSGTVSGNGPARHKVTNLTVLTIQTLSVLLQTTRRSVPSIPGRPGINQGTITLSSSSSLPARAAQPLMRMLGKESNANRAIGLAIVECLCVCARQLGRDRWMQFYHVAVRAAIESWQERVGVATTTIGNDVGSDGGDMSRPLVGIELYDGVVNEIVATYHQNHRKLGGYGANSLVDQFPGRQTSLMGLNRIAANGIDNHGNTAREPAVGSLLSDNLAAINGFEPETDGVDDMQNNPSIQPILNQTSRHRVNQTNLQRSWDVSQRASREDWDEWMRRFAVRLLSEAPSPALRATAGLAHAYPSLARELFSAAFVCCWDELSEQYRANLVHSLETAFVSDVSPEILQTLLNLAEFMEHDGLEGGLPIDIAVLADLALKCRAYAKALHYKEKEHNMGGGGACVEALISINRKLDLPEAALGVLKAAQVELERSGYWDGTNHTYDSNRLHHRFSSQFRQHQGQDMAYSVVSDVDDGTAGGGAGTWAGVEVQESWLAKLGSWGEALAMYERKLKENPSDVDAILGCMRCLDARGDWRRVLELAEKSWPALGGEISEPTESYVTSRSHRKAVKFCAQAAWRLGQWEQLETFASQLIRGKHDSQFVSPGLSKSSGISSISGIRDGGLPRVDFDGAFYSGIMHIHRREWSLAADAIDAARRAMDSRFTALMAESYKRAYPSMVTAQTLAEMEEIIAYQKLENRAKAGAHHHNANCADAVEARREQIAVWRNRLAGCRVDAEVHSSILAVRSLILGPTDEVDATLTLSALSRQAKCYKLAERVLLDPLAELGADLNGPIFGFQIPPSFGLGLGLNVGGGNNNIGAHGSGIDRLITGEAGVFLPQYGAPHEEYSHKLVGAAGGLERLNIQHQLYYAYVKHLWAMGNHVEAMDRLCRLSDVVDLTAHCEKTQNKSLSVACWLKVGEWKLAESSLAGGSDLPEALKQEVLISYKRATAANASGYKAWHAWALINFRLAQQIRDENSSNLGVRQWHANTPGRILRNHVVAAVKGFVRAISLGTKRWSASVQQDMLNLLTCLFKYGELPEVSNTINDGLGSIKLEAWLGVLPQLLARIHIKSPSVRSVLHPLLIRLGAKHPQALMYPLSVLLKSPVIERKMAAESLMTSLKTHSNELVEEALMVSSELIRVAILWLELWHEGLEDASRLYFGEGNVSGMLDVLVPLHEQFEGGAVTRREHDFVKSFGRDLVEARAYVKEYVRLATMDGGEIPTQGGNTTNQYDPSGRSVRQNAEAEAALNQAWDLYYTVFRRINKQLPGLTSLELSQCSPALWRARNLELGVPGSYRVDGSYVKIEKFIPSVQVITSKQRPRKIVLRGDDGKDYVFLLKGHEDLRQDERVMQLFGLVNALLARDRRTNNHDLNIQRYAISPLSHNCGVVGWVPHCDTLHSLIRDYRESKKIALNMENREMMKIAPDYDLLTVMQKVEVFIDALRRTTGKGNDLYEVLWIKSTNSEEWLDRRTKYTRSLAVMSMVGYILGLGDRHPSNLMLDQISGRVLHIDFGDCFEVAMHRDKYPEKIPFRLTRMLIKAMEVSGIEGSFRVTCERTLGVLRDSRDSLVAMLEAFVYDPLISWRLLGDSSGDRSSRSGSSREVPAVSQGNPGPLIREEVHTRSTTGNASSVAPSHGMLQQPIREGQEEDGDEDEEGGNAQLCALSHRMGAKADSDEPTNVNDAAVASHARSVQMYENIQNLAANLSSSSRIASITGGGADQVAAEGSIARSRLDRSVRQREVLSLLEGDAGAAKEEALNEKALKVIRRVQDKLQGTDFNGEEEAGEPLDVPDQVQRLIVQATSSENLCQLFIGWCAFW